MNTFFAQQFTQQLLPSIFGVIVCLCFLVPLHASAALTDGLVGHWTFDGKDTVWTSASAATTLDKSGNGNTGTLTSMNRATSTTLGKLGQGLMFDGATDSSVTISNGISATEGITISAWIKPGPVPNIASTIYRVGLQSDTVGFAWFAVWSDSRLFYNYAGGNDGSGESAFTSSGSIPLHKWSHVAVTHNYTTQEINFYVNGILVSNQSSVPVISISNKSSLIGLYNNSSFRYSGTIDDVRVHNRAVSATEIQQLYKQGGAKLGITPTRTASSTGLGSGLVGHWTFDGKDTTWTSATTGTTLDKSGNGNTGTLMNLRQATSTVLGKLGQALSFESAGRGIVTMGSAPSASLVDDMTISTWIRRGTITGSPYIISNYNGYGNDRFYLYMTSSNVPVFYCHSLNLNIGGKTVDTNWHHIVVTRESSTGVCVMYIDSASTTSGYGSTGTRDFGLNGTLTVGGNLTYGVSGDVFNGKVDDVRIYNRVLTATEIQQLYKQGGAKLGITPTRTASSTGLGSGLVGHWTFDGKDTTWTSATTGTTLDKSGNGNTGTSTNMSRTASPVIGKLGQGLVFDGVNDYVIIGDRPTLSLTTDVTFSFWFKPRILSSYQRIVGNFGAGELIVQSFDDDACIHTFAGTTVCTDGSFFSLNTWTYVTLTFSDTLNESRFYRNGILYQTKTNTDTVTDSGASFFIGNPGFPVSGAIDDVRVYNRVLTATEIQQLYKLGQGKSR